MSLQEAVAMIMVGAFFALVISSVVRAIVLRRRSRARGIVGRLEDGPEKGTLVAISLDGPATVLRLVDRDDVPLTQIEEDRS